jgi:meiotically up-regulated gene 157 (Mug157) protein
MGTAIAAGIEQFGIIELPQPEFQPRQSLSRRTMAAGNSSTAAATLRVYAYEVDGLGNSLTDFDDPNLPSLLAMPLLGYRGYDEQVYRNTRDR